MNKHRLVLKLINPDGEIVDRHLEPWKESTLGTHKISSTGLRKWKVLEPNWSLGWEIETK